jgi:hypothetical protein
MEYLKPEGVTKHGIDRLMTLRIMPKSIRTEYATHMDKLTREDKSIIAKRLKGEMLNVIVGFLLGVLVTWAVFYITRLR